MESLISSSGVFISRRSAGAAVMPISVMMTLPDDGEGIDRMNTVVHLFAVPGSEELGDDDGSTGSQPGKKVDQQVDDHSGGTRRPRQVHFSRQSVPQ